MGSLGVLFSFSGAFFGFRRVGVFNADRGLILRLEELVSSLRNHFEAKLKVSVIQKLEERLGGKVLRLKVELLARKAAFFLRSTVA